MYLMLEVIYEDGFFSQKIIKIILRSILQLVNKINCTIKSSRKSFVHCSEKVLNEISGRNKRSHIANKYLDCHRSCNTIECQMSNFLAFLFVVVCTIYLFYLNVYLTHNFSYMLLFLTKSPMEREFHFFRFQDPPIQYKPEYNRHHYQKGHVKLIQI